MFQIVIVIKRQIVFKNEKRIFTLFITFHPFSTFNHDEGDTVTDRWSRCFVSFFHFSSELNMGLSGDVMGIVSGLIWLVILFDFLAKTF